MDNEILEETKQETPVAEPVEEKPEVQEQPVETAEPVAPECPQAEVFGQPVEAEQPPVWEQVAVAQEPKGLKKLIKKWWFWAIVAVLAIGLIAGISALADDSGSGSSGGSGYSGPSISPYVTMVKTAKNSNYGITYGAAFDRFFSNPKWSYFKASTGEHVVEFTGGFMYDGSKATAKVQFVVDTTEGTLQVYHLSINNVSQSKLVLAALVKKVFESY